MKPPRIAWDSVAESSGGIKVVKSSTAMPQDIKQAYDVFANKKVLVSEVLVSPTSWKELVLECKEQAKCPSTAYMSLVTSAPVQIVIVHR